MYVLSQEASGARTSSKAYSILSTKTHILTWCVKDFLKCLHTVGLASRSVGDERDTSPLGTSTDACKLQIDMQETCTVQRIDFSCICPKFAPCSVAPHHLQGRLQGCHCRSYVANCSAPKLLDCSSYLVGMVCCF